MADNSKDKGKKGKVKYKGKWVTKKTVYQLAAEELRKTASETRNMTPADKEKLRAALKKFWTSE